MLTSRIVILTALCGTAMSLSNPLFTVNVEKSSVTNRPNQYYGDWMVTITEAFPLNKVNISFPVKTDLPEEMMVKFKLTIAGKEFPEVKTTVCNAITEELVGKPMMKQGIEPLLKSCPIKEGIYVIPEYTVDTEKLLMPLPSGKYISVSEVYMPGDESYATVMTEGEIKSKVLG